MKYKYELIINADIKKSEIFEYAYSQTKSILLRCLKGKAKLEFKLTKDYSNNIDNSYLNSLVQDGIKRIALVHLISFNQPIDIKSVWISINDGNEELLDADITERFVLNSMINCSLVEPLPDSLRKKDFIASVISVSKSDYGSNMASLFAYLISKQQRYDMQKFLYTWISFNGFYKAMYPKLNDKTGIEAIVRKYGYGTEISSSNNRSKIGKSIMLYLNGLDKIDYKELQNSDSQIAKEITKRLLYDDKKLDISAYGYLMTDFAYYLRCTLFHANKPVLLFSFEGDMELKAIRIAQHLLDGFITEHLSELFKEN